LDLAPLGRRLSTLTTRPKRRIQQQVVYGVISQSLEGLAGKLLYSLEIRKLQGKDRNAVLFLGKLDLVVGSLGRVDIACA